MGSPAQTGLPLMTSVQVDQNAAVTSAHANATAAATVSILVPIYNEARHIRTVLERIREAPIPVGFQKQIILVDDGSSDGTADIVDNLAPDNMIRVHHSILNFGKGTAIRIGLKYATGDYVIIQDADLEYDTQDYPKLLQPLIEGRSAVVYGSRFFGKIEGMRWQNRLANRILTAFSNLLFSSNITDEATGYKAFRRDVVNNIPLRCRRFEFCPEVTAKLCKRGHKIIEVPISYKGRSTAEGKKIRAWDGVEALWTMLKYRFID